MSDLTTPLTVSTINVNGIRAAVKQRSAENLGLLHWLSETGADIVCLQETRADDEQVAKALAPAVAEGWQVATAEPHIKGRSGVAVLSRHPIDDARLLESDEFRSHGRYLEVDTAGVTVASVYVQTGEADTPFQQEKERFMATLAERMEVLRTAGREAVVCGDWNIAHTERDIKNWKGNLKKSGFLPNERQWVTELLETGWVDVVRRLHPDVEGGPYSWWSWRGRAFDNDAGWRIDYHLVTPGLAARAVSGGTEKPAAYALRWTDHAPVTVTFG
ncbi:exodeoxyribonuclease III Xth [Mycolicibacterium phlei]|uniref:Exodeoxyribonuclease III n=1 Tax=Mycolicibacterium phlei DSM 43239 = CCUG 21000 TaxID=1226750 RepID=A0A5N5V7P9_MYCPH|nr:Exodeoxyribonuclease [Mycolicibacterium phlei]KAB7756640.1 exodeoxyribonuclease III [Mycolicibacterium phlei DSM 43239 = CCUG 21000]KXW66381.1 exodeoxyribonuclease III [Mycolicibacterium phlei DSM 43072]KXW73959.1 exodeoxyribonuclease III [Mycolicibacterium phlei DSM 43070]VEG08438.1 exodeoxyribonuclease III Xth [Mycobacteroides chelonae]